MTAKARIMIAEDEVMVAMVLEEELRVLGYEVLPTVSSGEDAVNAAASLRPDLILMDIFLRGDLDGISAAEKIHTALDTPVIYLTAHADEDVLRRAMATEPFGYIVKPCDRKTLHSTIETAFSKYHMARRLKESEERYRDLFENAHDLIQSVTPDGRLKYVNRAWREALGYLDEDVEGINLASTIHPESIDHCMSILQRVLSGEAVDDIEAAFITRDGRKVLVEGSATCRFENGSPVYTRGIFRDVTERKRSEEQILSQRDLAIALVEAESLSDALKTCLQTALKVSGMDCGGIYLTDSSGDLNLAYAEGRISDDFVQRSSHYKAGSESWSMAMSGKPVYSRYDDLGISVPGDKKHEGLHAVAIIPIIHTGRIIGCFNMASHTHDTVPEFSRSALETITAQVGNAIARLQAEEALHESKVELQSIFDSIQDFLFVLDSDGRILRANKAAIERLRYSEEELRGMRAQDIHAPENSGEAGQIIEDMISGRMNLCPIPLQAKDGTRIPVETKVTLERWGDRDVLIGISRDISERLRIEDALRKSEERYRAIVEDQTELICRFRPDGILTFVNEAYCRYFRMSADDLIGTGFSPIILQEDRTAASDLHKSISIDRPVISCDHRVIAPDGIRWMQWTARGIFEDDDLVEIQSVGRDITDKMNAQEALRASEEHFRTLILSSPAGIFRADSQGWCTYVNDRWCEITGIERSDILGHDWTEGISSGDIDRVDEALKQLGADDLPFKIEFRVQRHDKTVAWVLVQIMVERRPSGKVVGYIGTYTDITYLKHLEADLCNANLELEHKVEDKTAKLIKASSNLGRAYQDLMLELSERKRSEEIREGLVRELEFKNAEMESFVYTVSHDLRTPLITVSGFVDLIKSDLSKGNLDRARSDLDVISSAVAKMDTLLLDTLELSRIGRVANPPGLVPFEDIISGALSQVGDKIKTRRAQVSVQSGMPSVNVDHMRIEEALVNMIDNSIKYMGDQPHPEIQIGFRQADNAFFVKDNGIGVDESQHHKIFELFYKVDRKSDGSGAGLAIVKRIIDVHGGSIWIESGLGKGCTVCFTLPLNEVQSGPKADEKDPS